MLSAGGAAERAGVPPGARLLEVNGASVEKLTYNQLNRKVGLPAVTPYMNSPSLPSSHSRVSISPRGLHFMATKLLCIHQSPIFISPLCETTSNTPLPPCTDVL